MIQLSQLPRSVQINGHQEYWRGWFHGWKDGMAIVESEDGSVSYVEPYKLKFVEPPKWLIQDQKSPID